MNLTEKLKNLSIYEFMIISLIILAIYNIVTNNLPFAIIQITTSVLVAALLDFSINHFFYKKTYFPKTAIISGLFVGSILYNFAELHLIVLASALAILSKHLLRIEKSHVFNPASFGIFFATVLGASQIWWTAQPLILILILGLIIAWKFRRFDSQPAFLATYFLISAVILLITNDFSKFYLKIADSFIYFFAFFILVEPRTSPIQKNHRIIYGIIVAILASIFLHAYPSQFILSALLIGNVFVKFINKLKLN